MNKRLAVDAAKVDSEAERVDKIDPFGVDRPGAGGSLGMTVVGMARATATARLKAAGVELPDLDVRRLLEAAAGLDAAALAADPARPLTAAEEARFEALLAQRLERRPLAQILGRAGFWSVALTVTPDVLTPRPETESVLEAALAETAGQPHGHVVDLGVGPGTLLLPFLLERTGWIGLGVDVSLAALGVGRANLEALGLKDRAAMIEGDWDAPFRTDTKPRFDLLLSNPPYIASGEIAALAPEVRDHEPRLALDGGPDGLEAYRKLAPALTRLVVPGGAAVFEIGTTQGPAVAALLAAGAPGAAVRIARDLEDRDRVVVVRLPSGGR